MLLMFLVKEIDVKRYLLLLVAFGLVILFIFGCGQSDKMTVAKIETEKGMITCILYQEYAPKHCQNFIKLVNDGFYDGLTFHRVVPDFVIQGGDPKGDGTGGPGYTVPAEIKLRHTPGAMAMARKPDHINPQRESSGSQFYICLQAQPQLDGQYSVFGQTIEGMDVVQKIEKGDKILSIKIEERQKTTK